MEVGHAMRCNKKQDANDVVLCYLAISAFPRGNSKLYDATVYKKSTNINPSEKRVEVLE